MKSPAALADACFAVARSTTFDGERQAAISRGMAILDRHGLSPDQFNIPGRKSARSKQADPDAGDPEFRRKMREAFVEQQASIREDIFAEIFGSCIGCGGVCTVGIVCRSCLRKAEAMVCRHGQHGYCHDCR